MRRKNTAISANASTAAAVLKALANDRRLEILNWLKDPRAHFPPQVDGDLIRIPIPALSEQRRKDLVKIAKKAGEECKVAVRKARHEALDMLSDLKESGDASEDEVDRAKKKAEEAVSEAGQSIDQIIATKEKEILAI